MTGQEAITYIHSMTWDRSATGYEHAKRLLEHMGNPEKQLKYVHIGGTNGKGSTAAMLASVFRAAGYKTGLYTSPFLYRFHERMQIDGIPISDEELGTITKEVKEIVERENLHPSEFALVCCIAFAYFKRQGCEMVILEVGMGGANDSTNVIQQPEVAILTNIGLDHTEYLGTTLEEIAETKAGILKQNGQAVLYPSTPSVKALLKNICKERQITYAFPKFSEIRVEEQSLKGQIFSYGHYEHVCLPLVGEHQLMNGAVVLEAIEMLRKKGWKLTEEAVLQGMRNVSWPGRFEVLSMEPVFILDGGHNIQCMEALAENAEKYLADRKVYGLTGVLADKDYEAMYEKIMPQVEEFICITPPCPRALEGEVLARYLRKQGKEATGCKTIAEGVKLALEKAGTDGAVLCFGSLYSLGEIQKAMFSNSGFFFEG